MRKSRELYRLIRSDDCVIQSPRIQHKYPSQRGFSRNFHCHGLFYCHPFLPPSSSAFTLILEYCSHNLLIHFFCHLSKYLVANSTSTPTYQSFPKPFPQPLNPPHQLSACNNSHLLLTKLTYCHREDARALHFGVALLARE